MPADTSIAFALQSGPGLAFAERTKHDPRELFTKAGLPRQLFDAVANLGLTLQQIDHLAGGVSAAELRFTFVLVLRRPLGKRTRVGGLHWVSQRLYPLVQAACPTHPLLRETRREVLFDLLDTPAALAWLAEAPVVRFRRLEAPSPFTAAWLDAAGVEPLRFEPPAEALRRLHARLSSRREAVS